METASRCDPTPTPSTRPTPVMPAPCALVMCNSDSILTHMMADFIALSLGPFLLTPSPWYSPSHQKQVWVIVFLLWSSSVIHYCIVFSSLLGLLLWKIHCVCNIGFSIASLRILCCFVYFFVISYSFVPWTIVNQTHRQWTYLHPVAINVNL